MKIHEVIFEDRHRTIEERVDMTGMSWSFYEGILSEELLMKRDVAKFVPQGSKTITTECVA